MSDPCPHCGQRYWPASTHDTAWCAKTQATKAPAAPTPRTDANVGKQHQDRPEWVDADFARQLERELAEARSTISALKNPDRCPNCHLAYTDEKGHEWTLAELLADLDGGEYLYLTPKMCADLAAHIRTSVSAIQHQHDTWNAAMERAAEICDANLADDPIGKFGVAECARDIRASKLPLPTPQPGMDFPPRSTTQHCVHCGGTDGHSQACPNHPEADRITRSAIPDSNPASTTADKA